MTDTTIATGYQEAVAATIDSYRRAANAYERRWYAREALSLLRLSASHGIDADDEGLRGELEEAAQ